MAPPKPELTIIIVNWNTAEMTCACLASIDLNNAVLPIEIILIDNGSTDGSVGKIKASFPYVQVIENSTNRGFAAANNQGFDIAKGTYVLALNSDTVILGDVLQRSVRYMEQNPNVGAMGCRVLNSDRSLQYTCGGYPTLPNLFFLLTGLSRLTWPTFLDQYLLRRWDRSNELQVDVISGCYLLLRKSVLEKIGKFDEDFYFFGEETDLCYRIGKAGWKLMFAPVGEIIHHGSGSMRRYDFRRDLMLSSAIIKLQQKHGGTFPAAIALSMVWAFNLSRFLVYGLASLVSPKKSILERREHFLNLTRNWLKIWPNGGTYRFE